MHGGQAGLARGVDEGHPCQVNAKDWLALAGQGTLPALLQLPYPGPRELPVELDVMGPSGCRER